MTNTSGEQREAGGLIQDLDAQFPRLVVLGARVLAGHQVIGFFETLPENVAPATCSRSFSTSRVVNKSVTIFDRLTSAMRLPSRQSHLSRTGGE